MSRRLTKISILGALLSFCVSLATVASTPSGGISAELLHELQLYAQYAGAAYCYRNVAIEKQRLDCVDEGGWCPMVEATDHEILASFVGTINTETAGYLAADHTHKSIVLAIQGTVKGRVQSVVNDAFFVRTPSLLCKTNGIESHDEAWNCTAHTGFIDGMREMAVAVHDPWINATQLYPEYKLVFTGHSYGAAIAALLATAFRNSGIAVDLINYGQPHISGACLADHITEQGRDGQLGRNYRVTHYNDIVPMLPEHYSFRGVAHDWTHWEPEAWIASEYGNATAADVFILDKDLYGLEANGVGNGAFDTNDFIADLSDGLIAHDIYFGGIDFCYPHYNIPGVEDSEKHEWKAKEHNKSLAKLLGIHPSS